MIQFLAALSTRFMHECFGGQNRFGSKSIGTTVREPPCRQIQLPETVQCIVCTVEVNIRMEPMGITFGQSASAASRPW